MSETILVTGGVGTVGKEVVRRLLAAGEKVRATAHYPDPRAEAPAGAVDYVEVDYLRPGSLTPALRGVSRLLLIVPETPESCQATSNLMDAAGAAGVSRVVKLSFLNAGAGRGGRLMDWHAGSEEMVRQCAATWTILRPNLFMQNFVTMYGPSIKALGSFRLPLGQGRVSYVDVHDVAAVAVEALLRDDLSGRELDLTGPAALTHDEIAAVLSEAGGRQIGYVDGIGSDARVCLERVGRVAELPAALDELWEAVREGHFAAVSPAVEEVLGRPPIDFATFAARHRKDFQPATR
jgi:uncharacterized protein YbjT (DUF2867 family)